LVDACERVAETLQGADPVQKAAASYPFLTMLSVATTGWLMARSLKIARSGEGDPAFLAMKQAAATFYLEQLVPEAMGLEAAAMAPADLLCGVTEEAFAA
jgi:hypothetical protein